MEDAVLDVIVEGLLGYAQLRMDLKNLIRGKALFEERSDDRSHRLGLRNRKVDALSGINKVHSVIVLSIFRRIGELVEAAAAPGGTAVTGTRRAVPPGAAEGDIIGTVQRTHATMDTFAVSIAFEREAAFVRKSSVELDFFANGGFILTNSLCNGSFSGAIGDTSEDDTTFLESEVGKRVIITHVKYLPFWRLSGSISVRQNAT